MTNSDKNKDKVMYIYNPLQANFYMSKGIKPLGTGINPKTNRIWYKFSFNETLEAYSEWCKRKIK